MPWHGLQRGMSLAAVRARVPAAVPEDGGWLINGARVRLIRRNIDFAGFKYRADYYFDDAGYVQVSLKKPDDQPRGNDSVRMEYERLARALTSLFGRPSRRTPVVQNHFSLSGGLEWDLPDNDKAWLAILPVNRDSSRLTFGFRPDNGWRLQR